MGSESASDFETLAQLLNEYPSSLTFPQLRRLLVVISALELDVGGVSFHDEGDGIAVSYYKEVGRHELAYIFSADGACRCILEERIGPVGSWRDGIRRILRDLMQAERELATSAVQRAQQLDGVLSASQRDEQTTTPSQTLSASA
jgi:hypothetical protein